ncbi:MAG: hypothetical protein LUE19_10795 [Clostridiales bacterium]|nr:hypothetical protein [Clostridiales bacterium]
MHNKTVESIRTKQEEVSRDIINTMGCLEVLENSIYFSSERKDKDMSKPNAAAAEVVLIMANNCLDELEGIRYELKEIEEE